MGAALLMSARSAVPRRRRLNDRQHMSTHVNKTSICCMFATRARHMLYRPPPKCAMGGQRSAYAPFPSPTPPVTIRKTKILQIDFYTALRGLKSIRKIAIVFCE